jgi:asparagine synthase (glutamine-hydrolysing)
LCGITGFTHCLGAVRPETIRSAAKALHHRGPDQSGTYESNLVSLAAVRLKIIDLIGGDQPLFSDDRNTVLVFNGEIYNHVELRTELEQLGHRFTSHCDTEVVLHAFLQWGKECFAQLRGMFALAIWSEREKQLVLARDRVGMKPLYIHRRGKDIYFGSELKSLFVHPEIPRELDLSALHYYLALNYVPGPHTLVKDIEKLPAASWLEWCDGKISTGRYWKLGFKKKPQWSRDTAEEALDQLLKDSIRDHLIADVPLGIWLSGGVDSSTLVHYARQATSSKLKTFSIGFAGRSCDESDYAREVSKKYETEHHEIDLNPGLDLRDAIEEIVYYSDEPFADAGAVPLWYLSRLSRENVKVVLSGEGSDEIFGGYITYRADHFAEYARRIPKSLRRSLLGLLKYWPVSNERISLEYKIKRFIEGSLLPADEAHTYWNGAFSSEQQKNILHRANGSSIHDLFHTDLPCAECSGNLTRFLAFDQKYYLTDDLLQKVDRMSMAHSVEARPPFLDHRILEFGASLPEKWKIEGSQQKVILKSLMKNKLPESVIRRRKTGLDIPTHEWFRGALQPVLQDTLTTKAIRESGLFRQASIDRLVADHLEGRANVGYHLWGLTILFLWMKQWNIQTTAAMGTLEKEEFLELNPA